MKVSIPLPPLSRVMYMGESEFDGFATAKTWL